MYCDLMEFREAVGPWRTYVFYKCPLVCAGMTKDHISVFCV